MSSFDKLGQQMRADWDRRVAHDYRFWMSDGHENDEAMWVSGARDFSIVLGDLRPKERWPNTQTVALEIGCGVGRLLRPCAAHFDNAIGIDVSEAAITKAQELLGDLPSVRLALGNGYDLQTIESQSVHFLFSFASLTSVPTDVIAAYLIECKRVLRPDGCLRLQVYLGTPQSVRSDDTLHLRCYARANFERALELAGFSLQSCDELILPFQVSFRELGIVAYMVNAVPNGEAARSAQDVAHCLLPDGELAESREMTGRELECWMALGYARELLGRGESDKAKETLEYVYRFQQSVAIDIRDSLAEIEAQLGVSPRKAQAGEATFDLSGDLLERNLAVLRRLNPKLAARIAECRSSGRVEEFETAEGYALSYDHQPLDHLQKPKTAARKWVDASLPQLRGEGAVLVYGFASGYHVADLLRSTNRKVYVYEPCLEVFRKACERHDYGELFEKLAGLVVEEDCDVSSWGAPELLMRSQSQAAFPEAAATLRQETHGVQGLLQLKPRIAVLGPLHGGTLPIAGYTHMSLLGMQQRARDVNMSGFDECYKLMDSFLRDETRRNLIKANLTETLSQMVLEMLAEKPFDVLLCMPFAPISARALDEVRKQGVITAMWFVEDYQRFQQWQHLAPHFDFMFAIQKGAALDSIARAGAGHVSYLPCAAEPRVHTPQQVSAEERKRFGSQLSFVGAGYHNRQQSFASLVGHDFKIWGTEWPGCKPFDVLVQEQGRRLTPAEYVKIFCASDINLNLHSSTERDGVDPTGDFVNPRTFELASCEAFQLVDERALLAELLTPGEDIATFRSIPEMREHIDYYLRHPEERMRFAAAGRRRVLAEHTYEHRLQEMLRRIYGTRFEHLRRRDLDSPWSRLLTRSKKFEELHSRCRKAYDRGEEANLDGLVSDIMTGEGSLTETEQKLLFLYHVRKQMIRIENSRAGG